MNAALVIVLIVDTLLLVLLLGAQIELFRDLAQIREATGAIDTPAPLDISPVLGSKLTDIGFPETIEFGDRGIVLFLSDRCATCRTIARDIAGKDLSGLAVVLIRDSLPNGATAPSRYNWRNDRIVIDSGGSLSAAAGIDTTPAAVLIESRAIRGASSIPSTRALYRVIDQWQRPGKDPNPTEEFVAP